MELSRRLQTVAQAVTPGHRVADVGTDHGYVPIYLIKNRYSEKAIAMDVNRGPLERADAHIKAEGLTEQIETRLSDGLYKLSPEETDTVVIAGMGGELICRILRSAPEFFQAGIEFVLQPQSEWFKVRHLLHENGYQIEREWFLKEDGKYYVIMKAVAAGDITPETLRYPEETDYLYGHLLIQEKNPVLLEYLKKETEKKKKIAESIGVGTIGVGTCEPISNLEPVMFTRSDPMNKRAIRYQELMEEVAQMEQTINKM